MTKEIDSEFLKKPTQSKVVEQILQAFPLDKVLVKQKRKGKTKFLTTDKNCMYEAGYRKFK